MDPKTFLETYGPQATEAMKQTGIPASVTLAQAIVESGWGEHAPGHNFFGIKGTGPAGSNLLRTREVNPHGQTYYIMAPFRAYHNAAESFIDHGNFFLQNHRYANAVLVKNDPHAFTRAIAAAGYATDPHYADAINHMIDHHNLVQFDQIV